MPYGKIINAFRRVADELERDEMKEEMKEEKEEKGSVPEEGEEDEKQ